MGVNYYSNPNTLYNGMAVGNAQTDNARRINDVKATVAGYYPHGATTPSPVPITPAPTAAPVPITSAPTRTPTNAFCGNGICEVEEGEGCGLCPADCNSPTHCNMVSHSGTNLLYGSSSYGIVFDVAVGMKDLYFYGLKIYPYGSTTVKVYMKSGSFATDSNLNNWTKVFEGSISTANPRQDLEFDTRFLGESLSTVAFYISFAAGGAFVYSRDAMSNGDATVLVGNTLREQTGETLPSTSFANRAFYEGIRYDYGSSTTPAPVSSTSAPTASPTRSPTSSPTKSPTSSPTSSPTKSPTSSPTKSPTSSPTKSPVASPTTSTLAPVGSPTSSCSCCEELRSQMDSMDTMIKEILDTMLSGSTTSPVASTTNAPTSAPTPCADRTDQWVINDMTRRWCTFATNKPSATEKRCRNFDLYADCPKACGRCP